jgi:hypothetical protein
MKDNSLQKDIEMLNKLAVSFRDIRFKHLAEIYSSIGRTFSEEELLEIVGMNKKIFKDKNIGLIERMLTPLYMKVISDNLPKWIEILDRKVSPDNSEYYESSREIVNLFLTVSEKEEIKILYKKFDPNILSSNIIKCINGEEGYLQIDGYKLFRQTKHRLSRFIRNISEFEAFSQRILGYSIRSNP